MEICFQYFEDSPTFKAKFAANNLVVNNESLNALTIDIEQLDQELIVNDLSWDQAPILIFKARAAWDIT